MFSRSSCLSSSTSMPTPCSNIMLIVDDSSQIHKESRGVFNVHLSIDTYTILRWYCCDTRLIPVWYSGALLVNWTRIPRCQLIWAPCDNKTCSNMRRCTVCGSRRYVPVHDPLAVRCSLSGFQPWLYRPATNAFEGQLISINWISIVPKFWIFFVKYSCRAADFLYCW
jgi:hypothetical protein